MLPRLLLIIVLAITTSAYGQDINQIRDSYILAGKDREKTTAFLGLFDENNTNSNTLYMAYNGTALAMYADVVKGKYTKYKTFVAGRDKIEEAVIKDKLNPEIRFLRFSVQSNLPAFLLYDNRDEDKLYILKNLIAFNSIDNDAFVSSVWNTLLKSNILSDQEKQLVQNHINKMQKK